MSQRRIVCEHDGITITKCACGELLCGRCINDHMDRVHKLCRAGYPHPSWRQVKELLEEKFGGQTLGWKAELYCENQACAVREVEITVKEFADDPPQVRGPFRCPNCGDGLKFQEAYDVTEGAERADRDARCRVNVQRWQRDQIRLAKKRGDKHPEWAGTAIPASVFADDFLPE
jgi:hypothetical protein